LNTKLGLLDERLKAEISQDSFRSTTLRWFVRPGLGVVGKDFCFLDRRFLGNLGLGFLPARRIDCPALIHA
jgi:hypothetical protein